jgi:hypothetical protein
VAEIGSLKIKVSVNIENVKNFIKELRGLQTYKMFDGDAELYLSKDDVYQLLSKYIGVNTECSRCAYYDVEDDVCDAFVCDGLDCPPLPCEKGEK